MNPLCLANISRDSFAVVCVHTLLHRNFNHTCRKSQLLSLGFLKSHIPHIHAFQDVVELTATLNYERVWGLI